MSVLAGFFFFFFFLSTPGSVSQKKRKRNLTLTVGQRATKKLKMKMGNTLRWTPPVCVEIPLRDTSSFGWLILFPITMSASGHVYSFFFFFAFGIFIVMESFFYYSFYVCGFMEPKTSSKFISPAGNLHKG